MANIIVDETTGSNHLTVAGNTLPQGFCWWRARAGNALGCGLHSSSRNVLFYLGLSIAVYAPVAIPTEYTLEQNYPNPFNPETIIEFGIPSRGSGSGAVYASLRVYNMRRQLVRSLVDGAKL